MLRVNTGCSFLHPVTGQMIHPGQTYEDFEAIKETEKKEPATKKKAVKDSDGEGSETADKTAN